MPDMLVKLYELPDSKPLIDSLSAAGIDVSPSIAPATHHITAWVRQHFSQGWQSETEVSYSRNPISCWVATQESTLLGFACYDVTAKGFFGPTGVDETLRGKGIGKALLFACLEDMRAQG